MNLLIFKLHPPTHTHPLTTTHTYLLKVELDGVGQVLKSKPQWSVMWFGGRVWDQLLEGCLLGLSVNVELEGARKQPRCPCQCV